MVRNRRAMLVALAIGIASSFTHGSVRAGTGADARPDLVAQNESAAAVDSATSPAVTPAAAGHDYIAEVRANYTPENRAYWTTKTVIGLFGLVWSVVVGLLLLFARWSAGMRDFADRVSGARYVRVLVYFALFLLITTAFDFPLAWYSGFFLEHKYALTDQSFGAWLGEQGKDLAVSLVLFGVVPLLMLAYAAIAKSPRRWWLWLAIGTIPLAIGITLIQPIWIDPLYNKFVPLQNQELKAKILALAEKADIPSRNVYQVDKSKQTKKYNAYVNGFGASQRIVLWDTTLKGMKDDEILFVMGHEMGHYKLKHIWKGIAFYAVLAFALFYLSWVGTRWAVARFGDRWGFHELSDIASLPLLLVTLSLVSLVAQPLANGFERSLEHEADVFGLEVTQTNDAGARAFIKLGSQNKSNPEPPAALKYFSYTHPPLIERVRFALSYKPWEEGKPNRAFKPKK